MLSKPEPFRAHWCATVSCRFHSLGLPLTGLSQSDSCSEAKKLEQMRRTSRRSSARVCGSKVLFKVFVSIAAPCYVFAESRMIVFSRDVLLSPERNVSTCRSVCPSCYKERSCNGESQIDCTEAEVFRHLERPDGAHC